MASSCGPVILTVIPPRTPSRPGSDQTDCSADLSSENDTRWYPMDGDEATHDRSVAGSRPPAPPERVRSTAWRATGVRVIALPAGRDCGSPEPLSLALHRRAAVAALQLVIDQTHGLHEGIH